MRRRVLKLVLSAALAAAIVFALGSPIGPLPPLGALLDPVRGLYRTARLASYPDGVSLTIAGLDGPVTVIRDARAVPHVFAESDHDALVAFGYVVAQDRLFQMDFLRRVAAGRLSEVVGESALETDRFLRMTGMEIGVRRSAAQIRTEAGTALRAIEAYHAGVNAYIRSLETGDLPLEYRLLGFRPEPFGMEDALRLLQLMTFDLTFRTDDPAYGVLREALGDADFFDLYPRFSRLAVPIIPVQGGLFSTGGEAPPRRVDGGGAREVLAAYQDPQRHPSAEGYMPGKGSNNWAVSGDRSDTGSPILAGDVHLGLTLPSIWYEVHLATPTMNVYGAALPGSPLPVIGFNDHAAWTFTNTGADQIDYYYLTTDAAGHQYRTATGWHPFEDRPDTIRVKGAASVIDTLWFSEWGPAERIGEGALSFQWTAHQPSRTVEALWEMVHARSADDIEAALRKWDSPVQNVLFADGQGDIALRVAGRLPIRRAGHGQGVARGESGDFDWTGFIPFEEMPNARNPVQGYLASMNQQPADSTYRHYLGYDWRETFRSVRLNELMRRQPKHGVEDFRRYQSDVLVVQQRLFVPLLDTLGGLSDEADAIRRLLTDWDGVADTTAAAPLALDEFLLALGQLAWDEPVFSGDAPERVTSVTIASMREGRSVTGRVPVPSIQTLLRILATDPDSRWLDVVETAQRENAAALLRRALETASDTLARRYGSDPSAWRWGDRHRLMIPHVTRSAALRALWRGPFPYPGFAETLSPAGDRLTTHTAAWRMIVDFSTNPPSGFGVLPGGQSGNPFSEHYDTSLQTYLSFSLNPLLKVSQPEEIPSDAVLGTMRFEPQRSDL